MPVRRSVHTPSTRRWLERFEESVYEGGLRRRPMRRSQGVGGFPLDMATRRPALVVVDDDRGARDRVATALRRRFGPDYEVVEVAAEAGADLLASLRAAGTEVALITASAYLQAGSGTDFLAATRDTHPTARRLLIGNFADNWVMPAVARATTLGQVDHFDWLPWGDVDEHFLAGIGDILADWANEGGLGEPSMTLVGDPGDPNFRLLGDVMQRWQTYPVARLAAGTPEADAFLAEHGIIGPIPVVVVGDGQVVTGADLAKVSDIVGAGADAESTTYDLAVVG